MLGRGREVTVVIPFADTRLDPRRCGMQKNGWNLDTADVECSVPPSAWLGHALAQGLVASGFRVTTANPAPGPNSVRIDGAVLQFFVEPKLGFFTFTPEADIAAKLVVTSPSGLYAERTFYFKAEEESIVGSESNFQAAATTATQQAVAAMVAAVVSLLDRYPQLGPPSTLPPVAAVLPLAKEGQR
jgi:hypothetical protein